MRDAAALLAPHATGNEIAGGYRLARFGVGLDHLQIQLEGPGGDRASIFLYPPERAPPGASRAGSFAIVTDPPALEGGAALAAERLLEAVRKNDDGRFWEAPAAPSPVAAPPAAAPSPPRLTAPLGALLAVAAAGLLALVARRTLARRGDRARRAPSEALPSAAPAGPPRALAGAALAILGVAIAIMAAPFASVETDDAYTVLRYARNLVDHGAFTYNLGERICALTSPLHALAVAALYAVTGELAVTNKAFGAACFLATAIVLAAVFRRDRACLLVAAALALASPFVLYWTFGGLETPLVLALVTALAAIARAGAACPALSSGWVVAAFALGGLAVVGRYDTAVFVVPVLIGLSLRRRASTLAPAILAFAAPPLAWAAFASRFYGHVLPTSFYVKTPRVTDPLWLASNALYMAELALFSGFALAYGAVFVLAAARRDEAPALRAHFRDLRWHYLGLAGVALYGLTAATTHLFYAFRLFVPYFGAAALLAGDLGLRIGAVRDGRRCAAAVAACALALHGLSFAQLVLPGGNLSGARHGELRDTNAAEMTGWIRLFGAPAPAIRAHWRAQPASVERPLRLFTFAVGALPFRLEEPEDGAPAGVTQVYEQHTAYRHRCRPSPAELAATVDYVCTLSPYPGQDLPLDGWEQIFEAERPLEGVPRTYRVFFNPSPGAPLLPPRIDAPCLR